MYSFHETIGANKKFIAYALWRFLCPKVERSHQEQKGKNYEENRPPWSQTDPPARSLFSENTVEFLVL